MKRCLYLLKSLVLLLPSTFLVVLLFSTSTAAADSPIYNSNYLISNSDFTNTSSMSVSAIHAFLISEGSGLQSYSDVVNCNPATPTSPDPYSSSYYPNCGQTVSAAEIIYEAGQAYGINPQVILATMQKEQGLVTTPDPTQSQIDCAMGYGSCHGFSGFFNQVDNGTWQLQTDVQLMTGTNWWGYTPSSYPCSGATSLYSTGLFPGATVTFSDPGGTAETVNLGNSSTAALYCYTPYVGPYSQTGYSGSYNFVTFFEAWWGPDASACYNDSNVSSATSGDSIMPFNFNGGDITNYALLLQNKTGSDCVELHGIDSPQGEAFYNNIATGMRSTDPTQGQILPYQPSPNAPDTLLYVNYGGSSNVNVHEFSPDLTEMPGYYDANTNLGPVNPSDGTFVTGDFLGTGYDQLAYVLYDGSSGHVEIHICSPSLTECAGYHDVVTNLEPVTASQGMFVAGDFLGNGLDQLAYILYDGSSGHVEIHIFNPSLTEGAGYHDVVTNLEPVTSSQATFIAGHFLGNSLDQLAFVLYNGTSSGQVEIHMFNPSLTQGAGYYDTVTTVSDLNPDN